MMDYFFGAAIAFIMGGVLAAQFPPDFIENRLDFADRYAEETCPGRVRWEYASLYCLDENGKWIKQ